MSAFRRRVQISSQSLHIVVEGKRYDSSYYGKIADSSDAIAAKGYRIVRIATVYDAGGKQGILKLYQYLNKRSQLVQSTKSGSRVVAFALDSDAEPVVGGSKRSKHVTYTRGYDVEADILFHSDDVQALGAATSLSPVEARKLVGDLGNWHNTVGDRFRDWVEACCVAKRLGAQCRATYGRKSVSHEDLFVAHLSIADMREKCEFGPDEFDRIYELLRRKIAREFQQGRGHFLIKGKWLPVHLKNEIAAIRQNPDEIDLTELEKRLVTAYLASLDPKEHWARRYLDSWETLIAS